MKDIAWENSGSHTAQRLKKEIKWIMNQDQRRHGYLLRKKKIWIMSEDQDRRNEDEI